MKKRGRKPKQFTQEEINLILNYAKDPNKSWLDLKDELGYYQQGAMEDILIDHGVDWVSKKSGPNPIDPRLSEATLTRLRDMAASRDHTKEDGMKLLGLDSRYKLNTVLKYYGIVWVPKKHELTFLKNRAPMSAKKPEHHFTPARI
ncbi:hypothetical protein [Ectothiorhodospira shaposhnikovii]|uniref:hypothetical protein n=1 Tax=Ectothiorhodospira shaposhnikovii TaxID=1054 RepID=UPI001EE7FD0D|nr:hypothetical protein [Ectothiorhodospira shaposhnikovii]MCG5512831.1 hypothetical protein [Ectothiorhodospira shaposhnikovii]